MPRNRTSSDSRKPILQDTDCYDISMDSFPEICSPSLKHLFRYRAWEQWNVHKNDKNSIFYQTSSFCMKCLNQREFGNDDIKCYIEQIKKEINYQMSENRMDNSFYNNFSHYENINKYIEKDVQSTCRNKFPKEWTIVQLFKDFNPLALSSKYDDIVSYNTGMFLTILKHSAVKAHDLLLIEVKKPQFLENIYEKVYKLNKLICDNSQAAMQKFLTPMEARERYVKATQEIDIYVEDIIQNLKLLIGPWIVALTGNFKNRKSIEMENEIRKKVIEFLSTRENLFNDTQEKLIHLIARRLDLLTHQQIFVAITYILQDKPNLGYEDVDLNDLYDHLTWLKQEYRYEDTSTHPCILIVDELLDQMPFEMINTSQDFTRVCSFANLTRLWETHSHSMDKNGYVIAPVANCQAIVNPDNTLNAMEERMRKFFTYWFPTWKVSYKEKLSSEVFHEMLSQSDIVVYSGHGNGLNILSDNIYHLKTKAIVFLFGCGSTALNSNGLNSSLIGSHNYYHLGGSPSVIGFLWTISDFPADVCTTGILSSWIQSGSSKPHWQLIDKTLWKKSNTLAFTQVCDVTTSTSLPEVITRMRVLSDLSVSLRASLIYRGLPVVNSMSQRN